MSAPRPDLLRVRHLALLFAVCLFSGAALLFESGLYFRAGAGIVSWLALMAIWVALCEKAADRRHVRQLCARIRRRQRPLLWHMDGLRRLADALDECSVAVSGATDAIKNLDRSMRGDS